MTEIHKQQKSHDDFDFTDVAQQMEDLKEMIFNSPEKNHTKIQFIKEEIEAGRYQIKSNNIATELLANLQLIDEHELI